MSQHFRLAMLVWNLTLISLKLWFVYQPQFNKKQMCKSYIKLKLVHNLIKKSN